MQFNLIQNNCNLIERIAIWFRKILHKAFKQSFLCNIYSKEERKNRFLYQYQLLTKKKGKVSRCRFMSTRFICLWSNIILIFKREEVEEKKPGFLYTRSKRLFLFYFTSSILYINFRIFHNFPSYKLSSIFVKVIFQYVRKIFNIIIIVV